MRKCEFALGDDQCLLAVHGVSVLAADGRGETIDLDGSRWITHGNGRQAMSQRVAPDARLSMSGPGARAPARIPPVGVHFAFGGHGPCILPWLGLLSSETCFVELCIDDFVGRSAKAPSETIAAKFNFVKSLIASDFRGCKESIDALVVADAFLK